MPSFPRDPMLPLQWYIFKSANPLIGIDINLGTVWDDYTGRGVRIGIYDSLIERPHTDLDANYDPTLEIAGLDYDYLFNVHGTLVAGVIAAEADGVGIVGIAHGASITSLPIISAGGVVRFEHAAIALPLMWQFDVVNNSWGGNQPFDWETDPTNWPEMAQGFVDAAEIGRNGLGTIVVNAAGNERGPGYNSTLSFFQSQRHTMLVGAVAGVGPDGMIAEYSREGPNIFIVAPSKDNFFDPGILTTDHMGFYGRNGGSAFMGTDPAEYTDIFSGTSASAPMVTAIVALMLEANPGLGWRDVRDILAITARHTGSDIDEAPTAREITGWDVNAATNVNGGGYHVSQNYGFGLVDTLAAVRLAESWKGEQTSANEVSRSASYNGFDIVIPNGGAPVETLLTIGAGVVSETITLYLDIEHPFARDLKVTLISPKGTESVLMMNDGDAGFYPFAHAFRPWTLVSHAFRGEDATGDWRLLIEDVQGQFYIGVFHTATLTVFGDAVTEDTSYYYTNEHGALSGVTPDTVIRDDSGEDTINAAAASLASVIDLRAGRTGSINGHAVTVAAAAIIENAIGGDGADRIVGNAVSNHLEGWRGDDSIDGAAGDDIIEGGRGADVLVGSAGSDFLDGGAHNDVLQGGAGNDILNGGDGSDRAKFSDATSGVTVDLVRTGVQATGGSGLDSLSSIENISGSAFADRFWGDAGANALSGGAGDDVLDGRDGDDTLNGGAGADTLRGGAGVDTLTYTDASSGVTVSLLADASGQQSASRGDAQGDRLSGFERIIGSAFADHLTGNGANNNLKGGAGDDVLDGGDGADTLTGGTGADELRGGAGVDTVSYSTSSSGVTINLLADGAGRQSASRGEASGDQLYGIESIVGSSFDDVLTGDAAANRFTAGGGADILSGGAGNDVFAYLSSSDSTSSARDVIVGFRALAETGAERDRIDLRSIDAIAGGADDAFVFIGHSAFSGAGQLRAYVDGAYTIIQGNTDDDAAAEFEIALENVLVVDILASGDFLL